MSDAKFSPGPWAVEDGEILSKNERGDVVLGRVYGVEHFPCIDQIDDDEYEDADDELLGNARLISAAPDLLAACEAIVECGDYDGEGEYSDELFWKAVKAAREAMRKARDEPPRPVSMLISTFSDAPSPLPPATGITALDARAMAEAAEAAEAEESEARS